MTDNSTYTDNTWQVDPITKLMISIIFSGIILVGIVGNVLVVGLIVIVKKLHSTVNLCLACLAVTDLMILVFLPIIAWHFLYDMDDSSLGRNFCIFLKSIERGSMMCSGMIFLLVAVERYTVLCHPLKSLGWWTHRKVSLLLLIIYTVTVGICVPYGVAGRYEEEILYNNITVIYCYIDWDIPWVEPYETVLTTVFFFFFIPVLFVLYGKILIALKTKVPQNDNQGTGGRGVPKSRSQVIIMLLVVLGVFVICLLPFKVYLFVDIYETDVTDSLDDKSFFSMIWPMRIAQYINYASNPVFYFLMSDNFQQAFKEVFCRRCKTMNQPRSIQTVSSSV